MRNIVLLVAYDGTAYHGWQCQPHVITVQEVLKTAIERIVDHEIKLYAAGRTDAGVHACGQVVNFLTEKSIPIYNLLKGLNSMLPPDIRVKSGYEAGPEFHARYSSKSKTYVYTIMISPHNSPFYGRYSWHSPQDLDVRRMDETIRLIVGEHDFATFKKKNEAYYSTVRRVLKAGVRKRGDFLHVVIEATGFLRYMVRNIVGTLVSVGNGKITEEEFKKILESRDRTMAAMTAPPQGLFLRRITY